VSREPDDRDDPDREEYLWDRSGEPDELVVALEARLAPLRHRNAVPDWQQLAGQQRAEPTMRRWWQRAVAQSGARGERLVDGGASRARPRATWVAIAATVLIAAGIAFWWRVQATSASWRVETIAGAPRLNEAALTTRERWRRGEVLTTGAGDRARLALRGVGEVDVLPQSRLRLLAGDAGHQVLALDRGGIAASIVARPQLFEVATPQGRAVDLGCYFTLEVLPDGRERLRVEAGWVALRRGGREAFVPGGAAVVSAPGELGLPVYLDARELRAALDRWVAPRDGDERDEALRAVLALARREDALTLWHMLAVTRGEERKLVFDRLAALAPPPRGVTREGIVAGDAAMRDRWWESLGLGTAAWWRGWRVAYPAAPVR
jgi:hypothetical protein